MKNSHAIIRKANSLVEASYKLSVNEQRLILMLASSVKSDDKDFCPYRITIKDFAKLLELKNKNIYRDIEELVLGLREKTLTVNQANSILHTGWLSSIEYFKGDGMLELSFDPKLKPFLLELKERYTSYKLKMVIQLRSSFAIRLYELLKQYEKVGNRIFSLAELKDKLGIKENEYPFYANFKARVLCPVQKELREKTDITFEFREIKNSRRVDQIRFQIQSQATPKAKHLKLPENTGNDDQYRNIEDILELIPPDFRKKESIKKLLSDYEKKFGKEYVTRNILYANEKSNAVKPGVNLTKGSNYRVYLSKTLHGDFGLAYWEDMEGKKAQEDLQKQLAEERSQKEKEELAQRIREREDLARAKVYLDSLPAEALTAIREAAVAQLETHVREMLAKKHPAGEMMLKMSMARIALERMKIG